MLKNEVAQNCSKIYQMERASQYDPNAVNGTQIRRRMKKIFSFEFSQFQLKKGQNLTLGKNIFLLKKEYSTEYSGNISWNIPQNILRNILLVANYRAPRG